MKDNQSYTEEEWHRRSAVDLFNHVWTLLEKQDRTTEEDDRMIHAAHASRYHWEKVGTPVNLARGEWQVSRVYSVLERSEPALFHAERCLQICQDHDIGDFDLAFAYEALARASAVAGDEEDRDRYLQLAEEASEKIQKKEDREIVLSDLKSVPQ
jgi:hypothetical protein